MSLKVDMPIGSTGGFLSLDVCGPFLQPEQTGRYRGTLPSQIYWALGLEDMLKEHRGECDARPRAIAQS